MSDQSKAPFPFGYPAASELAGSVATPLLAGFSFALVGLIVPSPEDFRWPNLTLACVIAAGVLFIAAVQCGYWARQYAITSDDIVRWHPDYPSGRVAALQRLHNVGFYKWNNRLNFIYRWGIVLLLLGVTFALVPPGDVPWRRILVIAIPALAALVESCWIASMWLLKEGPAMAYDDQPDIPPYDVRARRLKGYRPLRRVARVFVPLQRIELTAEEKSTGRSGPT